MANSPHTVIGDSWSAGRLYDKIGDQAKGKVFLVMEKGVLCQLDTEKNSPDREKKANTDSMGEEAEESEIVSSGISLSENDR